MQSTKRGLCAFDNKRYLQPDGVTSLAFGHVRLAATVAMETLEPDEALSDIVLAAAAPSAANEPAAAADSST